MTKTIMNRGIKQRWANPARQGGFTLIEIILVIVMISVLSIFSIGYVTNLIQAKELTSQQKILVDEGKLALEFFTRELRFATEGTINIVGSSVTFDKLFAYEIDGDTTAINYNLMGTNLQRTSDAGTTTLATNVDAFNVVATGMRYDITITLGGGSFSLQSTVRPRDTFT